MDMIEKGEAPYHFVEVMACPGGCVTGGGQPIHDAKTRATVDIHGLRKKALYEADKNLQLRKSHENTVIKKLYEEYLEKPGSHKAHELLHTTYHKREYFEE